MPWGEYPHSELQNYHTPAAGPAAGEPHGLPDLRRECPAIYGWG